MHMTRTKSDYETANTQSFNFQSGSDHIILPQPEAKTAEDLALYTRFMKHIRNVPNSRAAIKVLSAIQFTADMLDYSDAHVAKVLVEMGLRAPRLSFPADFLEFADSSLMRSTWDVGAPSKALHELKSHWDKTGEDKFAAFKRSYSLLDEQIVA